MLIDFSFANYKSYRYAQQFTMRSYKRRIPNQTSSTIPHTVTAAAVYGANASGKSAFVEALAYAASLVRDSLIPSASGGVQGRKPFAIDSTGLLEPTDFLFDFVVDGGRRFLFEFSVDDEKVLFEELRVYTLGNRTARVYTREWASGSTELRFGKQFAGSKQVYKKLLRDNVLFLTVLGATGNSQFMPVYDFLANIHLYPADRFHAELEGINRFMKESAAYKEALSMLIKHGGFGIDRVSTDEDAEREFVELANPANPHHHAFKNLLRGITLVNAPEMDEGEREKALVSLISHIREGDNMAGALVFLHRGADGECYLPLGDESRGTLAAVSFLSLALRMLSGYHLLVVDEIDTSLHPAYVQEFVELFTNEDTNPFGSQLIFTTHDASLITKSGADVETAPLKRDQVWLSQKNDCGESELMPVTAFGVRESENIGRNYLNGVYGALPESDLHRVFAHALSFLSAEGKGVGLG